MHARTALPLLLASALAGCATVTPGALKPEAPGPLSAQIEEIATRVLKESGVPSASVAVVQHGEVTFAQAFGDARLEPRTRATPAMRFSIGSISKQFTAAALLLLAEEGKLTLEDPVSKWLPGLTRGDEVTLRQLLSHTSGYRDFWPQDYVPGSMLEDTTPQAILDGWAKGPLDFEPGTKWEYSNTNFVIAGLIAEKASGTTLDAYLAEHVFLPLGMASVFDSDQAPLPPGDPQGYFRYALGSARPAPVEGKNWMFAAGQLAMTAEDLAKWDASLIKESVLKPASYRALETEVRLANGLGTGYALGIGVRQMDGRRVLEHGGEVSGFTAENLVLPDDGLAVVVLTNQDAARASSDIAGEIVKALLDQQSAHDREQDAKVHRAFELLRQGKVDRALFTENANTYFSEAALADYGRSLAPLGAPRDLTQTRRRDRGGMVYRGYSVSYPDRKLELSIYEMPDGRFEQFIVRPAH